MIYAAYGFPGEGMSYDPIPLQHPNTRPGLRLLCLLVTTADGHLNCQPVRTLRPMPPCLCSADANHRHALRRWCVDSHSGRVANNPCLYLRETHAKRPTTQVLERSGKHRQACSFRTAPRAIRTSGVIA